MRDAILRELSRCRAEAVAMERLRDAGPHRAVRWAAENARCEMVLRADRCRRVLLVRYGLIG